MAVVALIPTFALAVPTTTVYLHRTVTHRRAHRCIPSQWWFKFANWITTGVDPAVWAAVHRKHHAYSDIEIAADKRDPHSPWLEGFWHIQLGNVWYYLAELREHPETLTTFARDVLSRRGWWDRHVFCRGGMGLLFGTSILWIVFGIESWLNHESLAGAFWDGILFGSLAAGIHAPPSCSFSIPPSTRSATGLTNGGGYQNSRAAHAFRTSNDWVVALLTAGEGFHNNHHDQAASAKFAWTRWESIADWGYWAVIVPLRRLGLATQVHLPKPTREIRA